MRATYKDLVQLVNRNALLDSNDLRRRVFYSFEPTIVVKYFILVHNIESNFTHFQGEPTFQGDRRIVHSGMMRGRGYAEGREFLVGVVESVVKNYPIMW